MSAVIDIRGLEVTTADNSKILGPITQVFAPGAAAVVGSTRSGKTTFFRTIAGFVSPSSGEIFIRGKSLTNATPDELRDIRIHLGFVFQNDALFDSLDVLGNVMFPLVKRGIPESEARRRALDTLDSVGLSGREKFRVNSLSGGMKKRLGLARAIAFKPEILLADDPLAGLDPGTAAAMVKLMLSLRQSGGLLLVAAADGAPFQSGKFSIFSLEKGILKRQGSTSGGAP